MSEIKPCPFCGSKAKEEQTHGSFGGYGLKSVYCQNSECTGEAKLKDWNKRVNEKP